MSDRVKYRSALRVFISGLLVAVALLPAVPTGAAPANQLDDNIVVRVASLQPGQHLRGRVRPQGYAADRRSSSGSGLNERDTQIYINGPSLSPDPWNLLDYTDPGQDSPEAVARLGP